MEQYEKSGSKKKQSVQDKTPQAISQLERLVLEQGEQIQTLTKEIARIKRKMDLYAVALNKK